MMDSVKPQGSEARGPHSPGHLHPLSPRPDERWLASLAGADLASCPQAGAVQHLPSRQDLGSEMRKRKLASGAGLRGSWKWLGAAARLPAACICIVFPGGSFLL